MGPISHDKMIIFPSIIYFIVIRAKLFICNLYLTSLRHPQLAYIFVIMKLLQFSEKNICIILSENAQVFVSEVTFSQSHMGILTHCPWNMWKWLRGDMFQTHVMNCYVSNAFEIGLRWVPHHSIDDKITHWWFRLLEPVLTHISVAIWCS